MREILKKYEGLFFVILGTSLLQALSVLMFLSINFDVAFNYIFNGTFQYSETQTRAIIVAVFLQLPALIFWLTIFIISLRRDKNVQKCTNEW